MHGADLDVCASHVFEVLDDGLRLSINGHLRQPCNDASQRCEVSAESRTGKDVMRRQPSTARVPEAAVYGESP